MIKKIYILVICVLVGLAGNWVSPGEFPITRVGEWGSGPYFDLVTRGNYAFCIGNGTGLDVFDIGDATTPVKISNCAMPLHPSGTRANERGIYLKDNLVYVALFYNDTGEGALEIIDITDPLSPFIVGSYMVTGNAYAVTVDSHYAYIAADDAGLQVIDVSNPSSPVKVGSYFSSSVRDVMVRENYAYVVNGCSLQIIDVANPLAPFLTGYLDIVSYAAFAIDLKGNYAYVVGSDKGLWIFDISNPNSPFLVGNYVDVGLLELLVNGDFLFMCGYPGLRIFDISDPINPFLVGYHETLQGLMNIDINGFYAFGANFVEGLRVIDIKNLSLPTLAGLYADITEGISDIFVSDLYVYIADEYGLSIIDASNPTYPKLRTRVSTGGITNTVYASGGYAYIADHGGLHIIDITKPSLAQRVGHYSGEGFWHAYGIRTTGNYAFTTSNMDNFLVIDISSPDSPLLAGIYEDSGYGGVALQDQYAYISSPDRGLQIMDISNPLAPVLMGTYPFNFAGDWDAVTFVAVRGNYVYASGKEGVTVIDVTDPTSPQQKCTAPTIGPALGVDVKDNYAYAAIQGKGFSIFDLQDPSSPVPVPGGFFEIPLGAKDVHAKGNYIYVSGLDGKLYIYRIGDVLVSVTLPKGGEIWSIGTTQSITWNSGTNSGGVNIELYKNNVKVAAIVENIPVNTGSYSWTVGMFSDGPRFIEPSERYKIGVRTREDRHLALSNHYFSIPGLGIALSLRAIAYEEKAWLIKIYGGKLDITVEKDNSAANVVEKYIIKRSEDGGDYLVIAEIDDGELQNGTYTFFDKDLSAEKSYSYYIEAVNAQGLVVALSNQESI